MGCTCAEDSALPEAEDLPYSKEGLLLALDRLEGLAAKTAGLDATRTCDFLREVLSVMLASEGGEPRLPPPRVEGLNRQAC
jgi:hypothetical protein